MGYLESRLCLFRTFAESGVNANALDGNLLYCILGPYLEAERRPYAGPCLPGFGDGRMAETQAAAARPAEYSHSHRRGHDLCGAATSTPIACCAICLWLERFDCEIAESNIDEVG